MVASWSTPSKSELEGIHLPAFQNRGTKNVKVRLYSLAKEVSSYHVEGKG